MKRPSMQTWKVHDRLITTVKCRAGTKVRNSDSCRTPHATCHNRATIAGFYVGGERDYPMWNAYSRMMMVSCVILTLAALAGALGVAP